MNKMKFYQSLQARYLLLIIIALILWPLVIPFTSLIYIIPNRMIQEEPRYKNGVELEAVWHGEAEKLNHSTPEEINQRLKELKETYPEADLFWVDGEGETRLKLPETVPIPDKWSRTEIIDFMQDNYDHDPFTAVALIGERNEKGFMVLQLPRSLFFNPEQLFIGSNFFFAVMAVTFLAFLITSWMFFWKMRKRLIHLQDAMKDTDDNGIPHPIEVYRKDEIGQLEHAFNGMTKQLQLSRQKQLEEEELRKQLIANLSHDLRTPLTTIRGHAYSLQKESLSMKGQESVRLIESKTEYLGGLIENLLSYTLLSAHRYPLKIEKTDLLRTVRVSVASWYPVLEKEGFSITVDLPDKTVYWDIDAKWMARILDNLFQNVVRHAAAGRYAAVKVIPGERESTLLIEDRGPGMEVPSKRSGTGIGLTIVSIMADEMQLNLDLESGSEGTIVKITGKNSLQSYKI